MENLFRSGTIINKDKNIITISIDTASACSSCELKKHCNMGECKERHISAAVNEPHIFNIGDKVNIGIDSRFGFTAVFYAYILPLMLVLTTIAIGEYHQWPEISTGISAIIILIPYYLGLFLTQKYFQIHFKYIINKSSE